jgi:hypothetical protein
MQMTIDDIEKYPELFAYLGRLGGGALSNAKIVENMSIYGLLSHSKLAHALLPGVGPQLRIKTLFGGGCLAGIDAFGCFDPAFPGRIHLDKDMVTHFEIDPKSSDMMLTTATGAKVPLVGVTVLHELVHWGHYWGSAFSDEPDERGDAFEKATYGKLVSKTAFISF